MGTTFRYLRRAVAVLCTFTIIFALFTTSVSYTAVSSSDTTATPEPYVTKDGEVVRAVSLPQGDKLRLRAHHDTGEDYGYHWQIRIPSETEAWVDISNANSEYLWVTYALVGSMLFGDGSAQLRCRLTAGDTTIHTYAVTVTVSFSPTGGDDTVYYPEPTAPTPIHRRNRAADDFSTHSIVINYLFENNALAFEPYGATVAHGSDFNETITSPTIVGYDPYCMVDGVYVEADKVPLNFTNIQADIVINVVYKPALVNFSIHHHLQNLYDDEYSLSYDFLTTSQAVTGSLVGDGLALTEEQLPGFRALAYEKLTVAADGSTVIEIRYDRNYYLVDFDMNGGYGTEPVYTRYGTPVGANNPTRHGYIFDGWELVSYDGQMPTAEQKSQYAISATTTIEVPAANLRYRARWITQETTYTMVFWRENADNNGYSYWGYLDGLKAMSGSVVSAQDWADRCSSITDSDYFTFNSVRSDKNILVEGDGSTVVNVYYTRNYYTITFKNTSISCTIPTNHTHTDACYDTICGREEHLHTADCIPKLTCPVEEHLAHTDDCYCCGYINHTHGDVNCDCQKVEHSHVVNCWSNVGTKQNRKPTNAPNNPQNAQVYKRSSTYYIYLFGSWYIYNAKNTSSGDIADNDCGKSEHVHGTDCTCNLPEHTHSTGCYRDVLHTHNENCYTYSCGKVENTHTDACYRLICAIPEKHTHNNNSSCKNTIKVVHRKYQADISDLWPVEDDKGNVYNSGERWKPSDSSYYSQVLVYLSKMPPDDFTLTLDKANYDTFIMHYYLQVLPGDPYDVTVNGKQYKEHFVVRANYNYLTKAEDFFDITGFVQASSSPAFGSNGQLDINGGGDVYMYYDRGTNNPLTFNNHGVIVDERTVSKVMYEAPLKDYYFVPDYPTTLEAGAFTFGGWYTSPGCIAGTEVDWDTIRMEDGGLQLYAKWVPITHRVRVFKDATLTEQIGTDQIVDHKAFAHAPEGNVTNGNYVFQGWFYTDYSSGKAVEKAFVFTGIPVTKDLDVYAKWSSHIQVGYRIEYRLLNTNEQIADPVEGVAIAGHNKTFPAKAGTELYYGYQNGYYPLVNSHTVTMSAEGDHLFTFYYIYVESVPYKVQYVDAVTGAELHPSKTVMNNNLSVVTENFVRIDGKMSDGFQKRLVLVAEGTDADNDGILDENVITFYYNADQEHAYYRVVHYIETVAGEEYREYRSQETVGDIGTEYTINALTLTGFTFDGSLTRINGELTPIIGTELTAELGAEGLLVELYYPRNNVTYLVRYLDSATNQEIYPTYTGNGVFGMQVAEYAPDLTSIGYNRVGEEVRLLTLSANAQYNVLEFYYQERTVSLKYQIVGPAGCGSLSQMSQNVSAISGVADGSVPTVNEGYLFQGWYLDADCTQPVPEAWVNPTTNRLTPVKTGSIWQTATYYAKINALETSLTIRTTGADNRDSEQSFLFRITGVAGTDTADINLTVAVVGNSQVTITHLPVGDYVITELTSWSWRYDTAEASREVALEYSATGTLAVYDNARGNGQWLDGNDVCTNQFN